MADPQRSLEEMRNYIRSFSLDTFPHGNQGYQRVVLQLVGYVGSGKSALVNSCKCALDGGEFVMYAEATERCSAGTVERRAYELTPTISIVDSRPVLRVYGVEVAEVFAQLGNFRPLNGPMNKDWNFYDYMSTLEDTDLNPNYTDLTVPVFVYKRGCHIIYEQNQMKTFLKECRMMTGFTPIVVITCKARQATSEVEMFRAMGAEQVISMENYTTEDKQRTQQKDIDILTFLYSTLQNVAYYMSHQHDMRRERLERKKYLLKFMHDVEVEKKVDEAVLMAGKNRPQRR